MTTASKTLTGIKDLAKGDANRRKFEAEMDRRNQKQELILILINSYFRPRNNLFSMVTPLVVGDSSMNYQTYRKCEINYPLFVLTVQARKIVSVEN